MRSSGGCAKMDMSGKIVLKNAAETVGSSVKNAKKPTKRKKSNALNISRISDIHNSLKINTLELSSDSPGTPGGPCPPPKKLKLSCP